MALDRPIFWLGLAGLSPPQRAALVAVLPSQPTSLPAWRIAKFSEADAWCISGAAARLHDDGILTVTDRRSAARSRTVARSMLARCSTRSLLDIFPIAQECASVRYWTSRISRLVPQQPYPYHLRPTRMSID